MRIVSILVLVSVLCVFALSASEPNMRGLAQVQRDNGPQARRPNETLEEHLARRDLLIQVKIVPVAYSRTALDYVPQERFRRGEPVRVALYMNNTSTEELLVTKGDFFFHSRPRMLRDGEKVSYRNGVSRILRSRDEHGPSLGRTISVTLPPGELTGVEVLDLSRWYDDLEPGQYELAIRHFLRWRGRPIESNTVRFEIVP